jgi:hypothetical protein
MLTKRSLDIPEVFRFPPSSHIRGKSSPAIVLVWECPKLQFTIFNESSFPYQMYFVLHLDFVKLVLLRETRCKGCFFKFGFEVGVGESIEIAPLVEKRKI